MRELETIQYDGNGYKPMVSFEGWRVAFLNYAEMFDRANIHKMERHLLTDEVFVLLSGQAALIVGEENKVCYLEKNTLYNVKKAVWHAVCVSPDAQLLIVENDNTCKENSEYKEIAPIDVQWQEDENNVHT